MGKFQLSITTILKTGMKINMLIINEAFKIERIRILLVAGIAAGLLWGCAGNDQKPAPPEVTVVILNRGQEERGEDNTSGNETGNISPEPVLEVETPAGEDIAGYTYHRPDGNRYVSGRGSLPGASPVDIPLGGTAEWLVSVPDGKSSIWAAVLEDGRTRAFKLEDTGYREVEVAPTRIQPGQPPALIFNDGVATILTLPAGQASPYSHPVILGHLIGRMAFIAADGDLVFWEDGQETARLAVNALPDARLITDGNENILFLSDPSERYDHGVLGDGLEAESATLVAINPAPQVIAKISAASPAVFEGIAPIWVDLNADGEREIILTQSDRENGARLVVYNQAGEQLSSGPAVGTGYRWRNQLGAVPTGAEGEMEVVDVLTPHLTGRVEFFRLDGDRLVLSAQLEGYTSHVIGSRNLDMGLLGDFDGDGLIEALLPNQERTELAGIRRTEDGAQAVWSIPAGGIISTNLAAVTLDDGRIVPGVGRQDGVLRIWIPRTGE